MFIEKINTFREELHEMHEQCNKMKILLGLPAAQINPRNARMMIDKACADYDNIEKDFDKKLKVREMFYGKTRWIRQYIFTLYFRKSRMRSTL